MLRHILNWLSRTKSQEKPQIPRPEVISQQQLLAVLDTIPYWEDKIDHYNNYEYEPISGNWKLKGATVPTPTSFFDAEKVNYGCGGTILQGWLNVDLFPQDDPDYQMVNLLEKHPFKDNSLSFGYSEDMMEHLTQAQSIFVLAEIYRCLKPGGVMRFSFPGLEGVLNRHYTPPTQLRIREGEFEAYSFWDHIHFYSKEEIRLVGSHVGFSNVAFFEYGKSDHPELCEMETRTHQIDLNTYVELQK